MTKEQIIKKLEAGDYKVEHDSACNCSIKSISDNGIDWYPGDECWQNATLIVGDDEEIVECIQHDPARWIRNDLDWDDIPPEAAAGVELSDAEENPSHDVERMVLDYLEDLPEGTRFYRDNDRGFANEYTSIIVEPGADEDEIDEDWDEIDAEQCAHDIAYNGDAATQAYNSIRVIA